jgi:hypothetical protein
MPSKSKQPQIPLPKSWDTHVKTAILHVVALARYALIPDESQQRDTMRSRHRSNHRQAGRRTSRLSPNRPPAAGREWPDSATITPLVESSVVRVIRAILAVVPLAACKLSAPRAASTRFAPSFARAYAIALPIPRFDPVMITTCPSSLSTPLPHSNSQKGLQELSNSGTSSRSYSRDASSHIRHGSR